MDNASQRDSFRAMRAAMCRMAWMGPAALIVSVASTACVPDKDKEPGFLKPPKSFDVQGGDLTFNEKRIEAFNSMNSGERTAHITELKGKAGSFKGQGIFRRSTELGGKMDDLTYGKFEIFAVAPGPEENEEKGVWLEVNIEYHLFSEKEMAAGWPNPSYIEFTGTLGDISYQGQSKPRKMELKVIVDDVKILKD